MQYRKSYKVSYCNLFYYYWSLFVLLQLFTDALNEIDETNIHGRLNILCLRASCSMDLKNYMGNKIIFSWYSLFFYVLSSDALNDGEDALTLDETCGSAYFYCGQALYYMNEKKRAYEIFKRGLEVDAKRRTLFIFVFYVCIDLFFRCRFKTLDWKMQAKHDQYVSIVVPILIEKTIIFFIFYFANYSNPKLFFSTSIS
jgi:tetratricopeptide (TPR) repeat protein